ncbi:Golgi apyrase [Saitozyma podzolica]|uniref:Golgi apyrase n=1 Tax=Saitozyma podzolica TaxID=1890683 RepID=A0A427YVY4_9TREE|nr:Golgi apyrase [Saitozyma podzolica]
MAPSITPISTHYALVIDAGSSGSRLQIYSWRDPDLERAEIVAEVRDAARLAAKSQNGNGNGNGAGRKWWWPPGYKGKGKEREGELEWRALRRLVRVGKGVDGDAWVKRVEPGISSVSPSDIPSYLAPLLSHALQQIPPSQHSTTPIYLLATAGMRLLPQDTQEAILEATCELLRADYPFSLPGPSAAGPCGENIRVISGEEEGMWGWVAVNYLMDGFGHAPSPSGDQTSTASSSSSTHLLPLAPLAEPPPDSSHDSVTPVDVNHHSPTFGFLDMGGASTQLAFSPTPLELVRSGFPKDDLHTVSLKLLSGEVVEWPLFVATWLGFGTNRARERFVDQLISQWRDSDSALDMSTPIPDPCLPVGLVIPSSEPSRHPDLIGSGQWSQCLEELRPLLEHHVPCPANHCLFAGLPTPHIDFERQDQRGFIGISEYWYTAEQVLGLGGVWDWGEWEKGMNGLCAKEWGSIERQVEDENGWLGSKVELSRLEMQCFKGAWISNVLHEGIGIPRLVDKFGNDTLTGGALGDTNAEAERRAREKGLLEKNGRHHFQSMDEVGETAISWTLGKMVIEASKAVQPRSAALENAWTNRIHAGLGAGLGKFEQQLAHVGIQAIWAYSFIAFMLLACLFNTLRRRGRFILASVAPKRRKRSISGEIIVPPSLTAAPSRSWWPFGTTETYSIEDGFDLSGGPGSSSLSSKSAGSAGRATLGRLRLWSRKLGHAAARHAPLASLFPQKNGSHYDLLTPRSRPMARHASMPLGSLKSTSYTGTGGGYGSQPPSPKSSDRFFTPGFSTLSIPSTRNTSASPEPGYSLHASASASSVQIAPSPSPSITSSPPRTKTARPVRGRTNSNHNHNQLLSPTDITSGWNDPPMNMLGHGHPSHQHQQIYGEPLSLSAGTLTPTAGGFEAQSLSRQSSRVNLSELGLAQRSASRAGTPHLPYDDHEA